MPIPLRCSCGKAFRVKSSLEGKRIACPECKSRLEVSPADTSSCLDHPERAAAGTCRKCHLGFCDACLRTSGSKTFCAPCLARLKKKARARKKDDGSDDSTRVRGQSLVADKMDASGQKVGRSSARAGAAGSGQSAAAASGPGGSVAAAESQRAVGAPVTRRTPSGRVTRSFKTFDYEKTKEEIARSGRITSIDERAAAEILTSGRNPKKELVKRPEQGRTFGLPVSLAVAAGVGLIGSVLVGFAALSLDLSVIYAFGVAAAMGVIYNKLSGRNAMSQVVRAASWGGLAVLCLVLKLAVIGVFGQSILEESVADKRGIYSDALATRINQREAWLAGDEKPPRRAFRAGLTREQQRSEWAKELEELKQKKEEFEQTSSQQATAALLEKHTGASGTLGFLRYFALYGTEEPEADEEEGSPLLSYLLWLLELGVLFFVPYWIVTRRW